MTPAFETDALRYVTAEQVETPVGRLGDAVVVSPTGDKLGRLDGVVVDPAGRRVPFLVVAVRKRLRTHRYLLPLAPSRIDEHRVLHVDVQSDELDQLPEVPPARIPSFTDDDLIAALFSPRPS